MLTIVENVTFSLPSKQWNPQPQVSFQGSLCNAYRELGT